MSRPFQFKQFNVAHDQCAMKVGTDGVLLGAWANPSAQKILDIGTGSGLIALMLAQRNPEAKIDAVEINEAAAKQAEQNFRDSPWNDRLQCYNEDIKNFHTNLKYDLIISNPPFFIKSTPAPDLQRHQVRHNELLSLYSLVQQVYRLLSASGKFSVILPVEEGNSLIRFAQKYNLSPERITDFIPRKNKKTERLLITLSFGQKEVAMDNLIHYNSDNKWTEEYKSLTESFYTVL